MTNVSIFVTTLAGRSWEFPVWSALQVFGWVLAFWITVFFSRTQGHDAGPLYTIFCWSTFIAPIAALAADAPAVFFSGNHRVAFCFYGVVLAVLIIALLVAREKSGHAQTLAFVALFLAIAGCVAKMGCYVAGCCTGVVFHTTHFFQFPSQIVESTLSGCLALTVAILILHRKTNSIWSVYFYVYSCARFILDFLRQAHDTVILSLSWLQLFILSVVILTSSYQLRRRYAKSDTRHDTAIVRPCISGV